MSHTILFVCTGNVCRSPMAAGLFNAHAQRVGEHSLYAAHSAGTWALEQQPASGNAVVVMRQRGIDLRAHRGRTVSAALLAHAGAVIVMTRNHYDALAAEFPAHVAKLHLMSELASRTFDIADPYGGSLDEYADTATELATLIDHGYEKIKSWISNNEPAPSANA